MSERRFSLGRFVAELRRRGVLRMATVYGAAAFLLLEGAAVVVPALWLPPWVITVAVVLVALGFPVALALAWAFEVTPEGVEREASATPDAAERPAPVAAVVLALVAVTAMTVTLMLALRPGDSAEPGTDPGRVVVTVFENRTGDPSFDAVGQMAADWVTRGLARTGLVEVIPANTAFMSSYFHRGAGDSALGGDPGHEVASETGAGTVVSGAVYRVGDQLQIQAHVTDVASGRALIVLEPVEGPADDPRVVVQRTDSRVAGAMATRLNPRVASLSYEGGALPTYASYQQYASGIEAFVRRDFPMAIQAFRTAHEMDTTFAQPLIWAATAYWFGRMPAQADSMAAIAQTMRAELLPVDALWLDYQHALVRGDNPRFTALSREGFQRTGGDPLWRYAYGTALSVGNQSSEVLEVFAGLDPHGSVMNGWWEYWGWPTGALHRLGRHREELVMAREAGALHPSVPSIRFLEIQALVGLGRISEASAALERSMRPPPEGARVSISRAGVVVDELRAHGHESAAQALAERLVSRYEADGQPAGDEDRFGYGVALFRAGYPNKALEALRTLDNRENSDRANVLGWLGSLYAMRGDTDAAADVLSRLRAIEVHPFRGTPRPLWQAQVVAHLGDKDHAVALLREAYADGLFHGIWEHQDPLFRPLRGYPAFEGLVAPRE